MKGKAQMPEQGLASALYYAVSDDNEAGQAAVEWALGTDADLRQTALVFDWCQPVLSETQSAALATKLRQGIERPLQKPGVPEACSRALAAIALAGHADAIPERELTRLIRGWWEQDVIAALKHGRDAIPSEETYALVEILHAVRDNLNLDLRESFPAYFKDLPLKRLLSYYPPVYETGHGNFRIPARKGFTAPDWRQAELARAADLSMAAYDTNALESQYLQGWLMHDAFLMRSPGGIPYEFLWANPYQPGLSYFSAPLTFHDTLLGRLFLRSGWDDDASWAGYLDGETQLFEKGKLTIVNRGMAIVGEAAIVRAAPQLEIDGNQVRQLFVTGLNPRQKYTMQIAGEEALELVADAAGVLEASCPRRKDLEVRITDKKSRGSHF